jgi:penicillin-binding protein 1A
MGPKKWWQYLFLITLVGALVTTALAALAASIIYPSLPSLETLTNYKPKLPLKIYSAEGLLIGEFGEERRAFVKIENVPQSMKDAVLAIEDRRFYEHHGIDTKGVIRAIRNNLTGRGHEGASTITMQVAKNFFSPPGTKRNLVTKIKEAMLAIKIERTLEKDQILELYLNQIYLGQRSYGFEAASQVYFAKKLKDLSLAECALLAGLPKAPSGYNPYSHKSRAINRQHEVLRDMTRYGFINQAQYEEAIKFPLKFKSATKAAKRLSADYVAEIVRISMYQQYGESIYQSGYKVYTTIKKENQEAANRAVVEGIVNYEERHGYRGPEKLINISQNVNFDELASEALDDFETYNGFTPALVISADKNAVKVILKSGDHLTIEGKGLRLIINNILNDKIKKELLVQPGAIVRVAKIENEWKVVQLPKVEASLVAVNPQTGAVNALIGGFDFTRNKFNHVTQAWRQPGSSFKPFIYSAAIEKGYSPATMVEDEPFFLAAGDGGSKTDWEPHNYDNKYDGPISVRTALTKSKNMVSIRILNDIGPQYAQNYITKFGFEAKHHPAYLAMALGAGSTTSWNLAAAYSVFANSGYQVRPYIITKITDSEGHVIESVNPAAHISAERVIDPRNAFLMTSMLQNVVNEGTARRAKALGRTDIAGKTGTTNDQLDLWFAGFNPKEVAIAWVGYDSPRSLGRHETGGSVALPIWIKYMETALKGVPNYHYKVPPGIVQLKIDPETGTLFNDAGFNLDFIFGEDDKKGEYDYFYEEFPPPVSTAPEVPPLEESTDTQGNQNTITTNPLQPSGVRPPPSVSPTPIEEKSISPSAGVSTTNRNMPKPVVSVKPKPAAPYRTKPSETETNRDPSEAAGRIMNPSGY